MRWLRIGLYTLAGILVILLTAVALLFTVDFGRFKPDIENLVTDRLQRELRIDGALHATVGSTIDIYAENVYFANPEWASEAAFVTAQKIDVSVDTWSLFSWPILIERAEIVGVDGNIEFDGDGRASWTFEAFADQQNALDDQPRVRRDLPVMWNNVLISDIDVSFSGGIFETPVTIDVTRGIGQISDAGYMETRIEGLLNDTPYILGDKTGPVENFLAMQDIHSELSGNIGEIVIAATSVVDDAYRPMRPTLNLDIDGPGAEYVTDVLNVPRITEGPFDFEVKLQPTDDTLGASVAGTFGEFGLNVDGFVASFQELDIAEMTVAANGPDIAKILAAFGITTAEPDAFDIKGSVKRNKADLSIEGVIISIGESRVTVDGAFPKLPTVEDSHLALIATGPDFGRFNRLFGAPGRLNGEFRTTLDLSPTGDDRTLVELNASAPDVSVNVSSRLSSQAQFRDSTASIRIDGRDISKILAIYGVDGVAQESFNLKGEVSIDDSGYQLDDVRAIVGDDVLTVSGHIGDDPLEGNTDLEFDFSGTDLGGSVVALGGADGALPKGDYQLRGRLQKEGERLYLRAVKAFIGSESEYELTLDGFLTGGKSLVGSELSLSTHGASLAALADLAGVAGIPDFPFEVSADVRRGSATTYINNGDFEVGNVTVGFDGHIGDKPMEDDLDFTIEASVPSLPEVVAEFGVSPSMVPPGDLQFSIAVNRKKGALTIDRFRGTLDDVSMNVSGAVGDIPGLEGTALQIDVRGPDLAAALPEPFRADILRNSFEFTGGVGLIDAAMELSAIRVTLGNTQLRGSARMAIEPMMQHGDFSLQGTSPDLFELVPEMRSITVPQTAGMRFDGTGQWADNFWTFDNFDLRLGEGRLQIQGSVDGPPSFDRTDLRVDWYADSVANLSPLVGRSLPDQPLSLTAHAQGTSTEITANEIQLTVGPSDLAGNFKLSAGEPPVIAFDVSSDLLDLTAFLPEPDDAEDEPPEPQPKKDRLIPDTPLPMEVLKSLDATVSVDMAELRFEPHRFRDISLRGQLQAGALRVDEFRMSGRRAGKLSSSLLLQPDEQSGASLKAELDASELLLGLKAETAEDIADLPRFDLFLVANAKGATVREMAGSLNAYLRLLSGAGRVKAGSLDFLTNDFLFQIINTLNPFAKDQSYTNVQCAAVLIHSIDGKIENRPAMVVQTEKLRIKGDASVNLKNEKIDVTFSTVPQKGLGISLSNLVNPYIKVVGTLAKPTLTLDPEGVLIEGGAAVATAGLSILAKGLKDRFLSEKDACGKAVEEADKRYEDFRSTHTEQVPDQGR